MSRAGGSAGSSAAEGGEPTVDLVRFARRQLGQQHFSNLDLARADTAGAELAESAGKQLVEWPTDADGEIDGRVVACSVQPRWRTVVLTGGDFESSQVFPGRCLIIGLLGDGSGGSERRRGCGDSGTMAGVRSALRGRGGWRLGRWARSALTTPLLSGIAGRCGGRRRGTGGRPAPCGGLDGFA